MAKVFIDGKAYDVDPTKQMLEICLTLGMDLTYFCWHPALHSVGACRQCAVIQYKDENDTRGRITMACMLPAAEGTRISIAAPQAHEFRASNIESLMLNHPHDCPVCDEGGECHLQDMTLMSGHNYRRSRFPKRTHLNQYLGPFVNHEMNRCIQCYRCVRFYRDYAGGRDLDVFACHDDVYFGRSEPGVLENEFAGNLVEVCPTGVFTDKTLRKHYTRKWDLTNAPSICHQCSLGCNILAGERYGTLRRILSRYNGDVNGYFLCDRGRFGYEYVNSPDRIRSAMGRRDGTLCHTPAPDVLEAVKGLLAGGARVIGIGSPRASVESNYMLRRLVGPDHFFGGFFPGEGALASLICDILTHSGVRTPSLAEVKSYDAVLVLGEDITNTAPMLALSVRQALKNQPRTEALDMKIATWNDAAIREVVQQRTGPLYCAGVHATKLDEVSTASWYGTPEGIAGLGEAVAALLRGTPAAGVASADSQLAQQIADALKAAEKPLVVSGTSLNSEAVVRAANAVATALKGLGKDTGLCYAVSEVNTMGLAMLTDHSLEEAVAVVKAGGADTVIVLENDLYRRTDQRSANILIKDVAHLVVMDNLETRTTRQAQWILPAGTFAESDGTVVSNEGRAQRFYRVYHPDDEVRSSWQWLDALVQQTGVPRPFDEIVAEVADAVEVLAPVVRVAPGADFRIGTQKIPRETHRYSGRTAITAAVNVSEPKPPSDHDSPLSFTMEGYHGIPPSPDIPFYWSPGWNSVQAMARYQREVGGPLKGGNPGIRLLEPGGSAPAGATRKAATPSEVSGTGETLVVPLYHIFGSEELSARSPAIRERGTEAYLALHATDGGKLGLREPGGRVRLHLGDRELTLSVLYDNTLPEGVAGLSVGGPGTTGIRFPLRAKITALEPEDGNQAAGSEQVG